MLMPKISYTSDDPIGVELAGAMKNVYAIVTVRTEYITIELTMKRVT